MENKEIIEILKRIENNQIQFVNKKSNSLSTIEFIALFFFVILILQYC